MTRAAGPTSGGVADDGVLAIDVGLTNCKAVLFALDGRILRRAAVPYETRRPRPGWVEQDPEDWWTASVAAVRALFPPGSAPRPRVAAVAVTAHMHALVPLDAACRSLGPALILGDRRAAAEAEEIEAEVGVDEVFEATGTAMDPSMPAAKIRWVWRHEPDRWGRTAWWLGCKDALRARMTGEVATEPVDACATSLYDLRSGTWSRAIADAAHARPSSLPPLRQPEDVAGRLQAGPAAELGLEPGTPVIVGAGDDVEVLGNGLLEPGACLEHLGTTGSILAVAADAAPDPDRALELYPHTIRGLWVLGGSMTTAGGALEWAAQTLGYASIRDAAACLGAWPPGPDAPHFLADLAGSRSPVRDPSAHGAWLGMRPETTRDDLMLAAFEGVALGIAAILERAEQLVGAGPPIAVSAGESADPRWLGARADVYGRPLAVLETPEPTALGLLALATAALGIDASPSVAVRRLVRTDSLVEPRHRWPRVRREAHRLLASSLRPVWRQVGGTGSDGGRARSSEPSSPRRQP